MAPPDRPYSRILGGPGGIDFGRERRNQTCDSQSECTKGRNGNSLESKPDDLSRPRDGRCHNTSARTVDHLNYLSLS